MDPDDNVGGGANGGYHLGLPQVAAIGNNANDNQDDSDDSSDD